MITLEPLIDEYSIYQLDVNQPIPTSIFDSSFYSITKTNEEISIVSTSNLEFESVKSNKKWNGFKVEGILDFSLVGIIHEITKPLKENKISVFVISTYNTDYLFVKKDAFKKTLEIFKTVENINISLNEKVVDYISGL